MSLKDLHSIFKNPAAVWRGKPFWSWNGELEKEELLRQGKILGEMGFGGYFMHSRSGLSTEYLGDEWFDLINVTADAGEADGLETWLYDEDRWPSGSAGGMVSEDESLRMKSLSLFETSLEKFSWDKDMIASFVILLKEDRITMSDFAPIKEGDNIETAFEKLKGDGERKVIYFKIVPDKPNSNYNGNTYIDTMSRKAVDRFIELTHEKYKSRCGDRFGKSIKGIFTDEPHRGETMSKTFENDGVRSCIISWTDDLFEEFEKRYGYNPIPLLPRLFYRLNEEKMEKVRIDYIDLCCNLFNERFAVPCNEWCKENGIVFTGHVLHEDSLTSQTTPNGSLMRFYLNMEAPGVDVLTGKNNRYWLAKQLSSVARQFDKKWLLSELYGCTGWEYSLRSHKALGDWQALFGINLRCPHLSWYTMEGESKRDYPASISYQSSYWKDYNFVESYFARFGLMISQGESICDTLVLSPIESVWGIAHINWANWVECRDEDVRCIEGIYAKTFHQLAENRIDFDYGEEQILAENYRLEKTENGALLYVGKCPYKKVVISGALTLRESTYNILKEFVSLGGRVIFCDDVPAYVGGIKSDAFVKLAEDGEKVSLNNLGEYLLKDDICPIKSEASKTVFAQARKIDGGYIYAFINIDRDNPAGKVKLSAPLPDYQLQFWDMESGSRYEYPAKIENGNIIFEIDMDAVQSVMLVFAENKEELPIFDIKTSTETGKLSEGEFEFELEEPNVCVLDYARIKVDNDAEFSPLKEVLKIDNELRDRLGIERRGGEMLQPWFAKNKYKAPLGNVTLEYPFYIDVLPTETIYLAGERPEHWNYYCNGVKLENKNKNDFWVDNAFKKMEIPKSAIKQGKNIITATTEFKRISNIESVYIVGNFGVIAKAGESRLVELPKTLPLSGMEEKALPFYGARTTIIIPKEKYLPLVDANAKQIFIKVPNASGSVANVEYGNKKTVLAWEPWTADITEAVKEGLDIKVTLVNSRRNTFGPLHCVPTILWAYGPPNFVSEGDGFSDEYARIPASIGEITFLAK